MYHDYRELPSNLTNKRLVVCKLLKPLYGTKQGAHDWYTELRRIFVMYGYSVSHADEAIFYKFNGDDYTIVAAATDDFTIIGNSTESTSLIKKQLSKHFEITDMGDISWLLGVSISRNIDEKTISLGQQAYIEQITGRFNLQDARPAITPMEPGVDLSIDSPSVSPTLLTANEKRGY
jgi:hypothetical protein